MGAALHTKKIKPKLEINSFLKENVSADIFLTIIVSGVLGIVAYAITYVIFKINNPEIILVSLLAAVLAMAITIPITVISTFWLFKHGYDPDDIMGPYITSIGDVASIIALLIAVMVIL